MRIYGGLILFAVYLIWVLYRLLVKRDLRQNKEAVSVYFAFIVVWAVIYGCIIYL